MLSEEIPGPLVYRNQQGRPLTKEELDSNFKNFGDASEGPGDLSVAHGGNCPGFLRGKSAGTGGHPRDPLWAVNPAEPQPEAHGRRIVFIKPEMLFSMGASCCFFV